MVKLIGSEFSESVLSVKIINCRYLYGFEDGHNLLVNLNCLNQLDLFLKTILERNKICYDRDDHENVKRNEKLLLLLLVPLVFFEPYKIKYMVCKWHECILISHTLLYE